jgi:hypothetical protein
LAKVIPVSSGDLSSKSVCSCWQETKSVPSTNAIRKEGILIKKGKIRSRKITYSQLEKKDWNANKKKEKAERPSLFTRIVLSD